MPLMGVTAAFIFAAQMFNFQVVGGTSGHLLGGVLAAVLLGPWAGTLVMACVIAVQALVFQDGGLVVMGANIFNMGVVGTLGGYYALPRCAGLLGGEARARIPAAGIAAWVVGRRRRRPAWPSSSPSPGTTPLAIALPAMVGVHVFIGIGEALITMAALGVHRRHPSGPVPAARCGDPARLRRRRVAGPTPAAGGRLMVDGSRRYWWVVRPRASPRSSSSSSRRWPRPDPDGLEAVAGHHGLPRDGARRPVLDHPRLHRPGLDGPGALDDPRRAHRRRHRVRC